MDKNNRILIAAILLIFVTLLSFNIDSITGASTKDSDSPAVTISPKVIRSGERVTATIKTGEWGIYKQGFLYDDDFPYGAKKWFTENVCDGSYKCYSTDKENLKFSFSTSTALPEGFYHFCVKDIKLADEHMKSGNYNQRAGYLCGEFMIKNEEIVE